MGETIELIVKTKSVNNLEKILPTLDRINQDSSLHVKIRIETTVNDDYFIPEDSSGTKYSCLSNSTAPHLASHSQPR